MRDNKEQHKDNQDLNQVKTEDYEKSEVEYGLESVTKGIDFVEGDKTSSPHCGGL
ncbi:hypothetical protein [Pseudalkalibacillus caeni]|uniref:hypothetical protein n=1 Tax=Exobacillus caeni TaxID=2574798 RepID=UPI0014853389|nr:hypothetical protein [Pseudalkalibacillus caeni]